MKTIEIINFHPFSNSIAWRAHTTTRYNRTAFGKAAYVLCGRHGFVANGYVRVVRPFEIGEFVRKSFVKYIVEHLGSTGKFRGKLRAPNAVHTGWRALH